MTLIVINILKQILQTHRHITFLAIKAKMSDNKEILALLKEIQLDVVNMKQAINQLQEDNNLSANNAEKMYKTLNAKFDMFKNLESETRKTMEEANNTKHLTRPGFFKQLFLEEREKYMDKLYTQAEIDVIAEMDVVKKKKKEHEKNIKIGALIYMNHIKPNNPVGRNASFESVFQEYLKNASK